jgi:hypothetical protein
MVASKRNSHPKNHRRDKSRMAKESERTRFTHQLENEGGPSQNGKITQASERGTLTSWKAQRERQVRMAKESEGVGGTHSLASTERAASQESEEIK